MNICRVLLSLHTSVHNLRALILLCLIKRVWPRIRTETVSNSIREAYETAMAKKSKGKGHALIHPSFPPQAAPQPSYMGSQSMPPSPATAQDAMLDPSNMQNPMNEGY